MAFDYEAFKAEFKRKKRQRGAQWWYGRFWAQDVVTELGQSAAEFTTLPWHTRQLDVSYLHADETGLVPTNNEELSREELRLTRRLLRSAGQDVFIQELLQEVFSELAVDAAMRKCELDALRDVRDGWIEMIVPAAV